MRIADWISKEKSEIGKKKRWTQIRGWLETWTNWTDCATGLEQEEPQTNTKLKKIGPVIGQVQRVQVSESAKSRKKQKKTTENSFYFFFFSFSISLLRQKLQLDPQERQDPKKWFSKKKNLKTSSCSFLLASSEFLIISSSFFNSVTTLSACLCCFAAWRLAAFAKVNQKKKKRKRKENKIKR